MPASSQSVTMPTRVSSPNKRGWCWRRSCSIPARRQASPTPAPLVSWSLRKSSIEAELPPTPSGLAGNPDFELSRIRHSHPVDWSASTRERLCSARAHRVDQVEMKPSRGGRLLVLFLVAKTATLVRGTECGLGACLIVDGSLGARVSHSARSRSPSCAEICFQEYFLSANWRAAAPALRPASP